MPPKKKAPKGEQAKPGRPAKGKGKGKQTASAKMSLRKNPKRKVLVDAVNETTAKKPAKVKAKSTDRTTDSEKSPDFTGIELSPGESEDDFTDAEVSSDYEENSSSNAVVDESDRAKGPQSSEVNPSTSENLPPAVAGEIGKHVDAAMQKYLKGLKRKKKGKKSKKRRHQESSSDSSDDSESSSDSSSMSTDSEEEYSSEGSARRSRSRKRRKVQKNKHKRRKRGERQFDNPSHESPSVSTVYTRGCKSPQRAVMGDSSDGTLDGGGLSSGGNTDDFIDSLNTSCSKSSPILDRRHSHPRSPTDRGDKSRQQGRGDRRAGSTDREGDPHKERYREQADAVIRDLHQNKADLAKLSGESLYFASLIRDFKHFHLTSHVDKKIKERIGEQDFTVDFRKLIPRSRAKRRYDDRLQVVHREGSTFFAPAEEGDLKEITSYKTWEVAFKIFMGVFNQFWPQRMTELLQYSHVIQTASLSHPWENVYNYDIAFREIMTEQPGTHWGMISHQTWALQLGETTSRFGGNSMPVGHNPSKSVTPEKKPCWKFNKGKCTHGEFCEFDHRCSHCGKRGHGRHECFKRQRSERDKGREVKREKHAKN